ncbi:MAG TPA: helix-turn-helix transcriptional regulator [Ktedonobacterales bacterium]|nr:helix-turn-helix transcriptional regulator [Ktedonobacterales bacterium]
MKTTSTSKQARDPNELTRAKLELIAAREQGQPDTIGQALRRYPAYADELTAFAAALIATEADPWGDSLETILADTQAIAGAARAQAFAAVFGAGSEVAGVAAAPAARSLKELWQARGLTMQAVAQRLGLGLDVLSALGAGRIRVASAPERLLRALSDLLDASLDQVSGAMSLRLAPANLRSRTGGETEEQLDFADAVRASEEMTPAQKAAWLKND